MWLVASRTFLNLSRFGNDNRNRESDISHNDSVDSRTPKPVRGTVQTIVTEYRRVSPTENLSGISFDGGVEGQYYRQSIVGGISR